MFWEETPNHLENLDNYHREVFGQIGCKVWLHVSALYWNRAILQELLEVRRKKEITKDITLISNLWPLNYFFKPKGQYTNIVMLTPDRQHNLYTKIIFNLSNHIYIIFTHYKKKQCAKKWGNHVIIWCCTDFIFWFLRKIYKWNKTWLD